MKWGWGLLSIAVFTYLYLSSDWLSYPLLHFVSSLACLHKTMCKEGLVHVHVYVHGRPWCAWGHSFQQYSTNFIQTILFQRLCYKPGERQPRHPCW